MLIKQMNEVQDIYKGKSLIKTEEGFQCPVCGKSYKQEKRAIKHLEEQNCFNAVDIFSGTDRERVAYDLYKEIIQSISSKSRVSYPIFRKSPTYKAVIQFSLFCTINEVRDIRLYYAFIRDWYGFRHMSGILKKGVNESTLKEYREWLYVNPEYINSERFLEVHDDFLHIHDPNHFIRSIEKAHVSLSYIIKKTKLPLDYFLERLPILYRDRLQAHYDMITDTKNR